jgi:hypothetical protein
MEQVKIGQQQPADTQNSFVPDAPPSDKDDLPF